MRGIVKRETLVISTSDRKLWRATTFKSRREDSTEKEIDLVDNYKNEIVNLKIIFLFFYLFDIQKSNIRIKYSQVMITVFYDENIERRNSCIKPEEPSIYHRKCT